MSCDPKVFDKYMDPRRYPLHESSQVSAQGVDGAVPVVAQRQLPGLNQPAPDFDAITTQGPRKLADSRGKCLELSSHPADITPVCTNDAQSA